MAISQVAIKNQSGNYDFYSFGTDANNISGYTPITLSDEYKSVVAGSYVAASQKGAYNMYKELNDRLDSLAGS